MLGVIIKMKTDVSINMEKGKPVMVETVKTDKNPWYKRWWAIILFIIFGIGMLNAIITDQSSSSSKGSLVTKNPGDILPTRAEIDTEFTIDYNNDNVNNRYLDTIGFVQGQSMPTSKLEGSMGIISVGYSVLKFNSRGNASAWYEQEVNKIKSVGGYKEVTISECFAYKESYGISLRTLTALCLDRNIVFEVSGEASGTLRSSDSFVKEGVSIVKRRIRS